VDRELLPVQLQPAPDVVLEGSRADQGFGPQPQHQLIAHRPRILALGGPAPELLFPGRQHPVGLLASASAGGWLRRYPAGPLPPAELAVDLLMGGMPEKADGAV